MLLPLTSETLASLTKTEREVAQFINQNEDRLSQLSIVDIAYETFSSPATVSRAIRKCRVNGFNELRYKLASGDQDHQVVEVNEILNKSLVEAHRTIEQISMGDILGCVRHIRAPIIVRPPSEMLKARKNPSQLVKYSSNRGTT